MMFVLLFDHFLRANARLHWQDNPQKIGPLHLGYAENRGAFYGLGKAKPKQILLLQSIFVVCAVLYAAYSFLTGKRKLHQLAWFLIALGGLGNLMERVLYGFVTDYLSLNQKLYFNLADIMVFIGASFALLNEVFTGMLKMGAIFTKTK